MNKSLTQKLTKNKGSAKELKFVIQEETSPNILQLRPIKDVRVSSELKGFQAESTKID